ncbi:phosphonate ABC transporter ATP-binding protein [Clostridium sp. D2Q-11]|uniref:Phosphonate ABC transporter ATP-binding protein n=1 Tax=Anaeromonas frigoriresistens TaxID=2683708 RepID=A0A942V3M4_9FIRM|nr:phosphonate ABC transporter ATP-binding protein [Anaeromonas frigoriresistens]MBS4539327.1 phosphonate ABC transporter ATP-binding protein [Anaeromonas frigoriresistens]
MLKKEIISINNISKEFKGKKALSSLSFNIQKGELIALIGSSGSGKTTLLNIFSSSIDPTQGEVIIDGKGINEYKSNKVFAKKVGMIRQQFDLVEELPVIHNVLAGRLSQWSTTKSILSLLIPQDKTLAIKSLKRVGLEDKLYEKTSNLSGGQKQRVALARLLVQNPEIVLADEPVASLDPTRSEDVLSLLVSLAKEENKTLITSLHSVKYAKKHFNRIIALRNGKIFFDLPTKDITESRLEDLYSLQELDNNE